jgi:uncharacterized DUF497 family protein
MTFKPIRYSDHAALRLTQRRISRADVRRIIARGMRDRVSTRSGREQRWKSCGKIGKRTFCVIFIERARELEIVTIAPAN